MGSQKTPSARSLLLVAGLVAACSFGATARATAGYPKVIKDQLSLRAEPACTLCHHDTTGGKNTVDKAFGRWLLENGLLGYQDGALRELLAAMDQQGVDSDGDCMTNIDELRAGTDPNVKNASTDGGTTGCVADDATSPPLLRTGCGVHPSGATGWGDAPPVALILGFSWLFFQHRRRPRIDLGVSKKRHTGGAPRGLGLTRVSHSQKRRQS